MRSHSFLNLKLSCLVSRLLDIGARYTKFGFIGEFSPRCIIPTEIYCTRTEKIRKIFDYENDQDLYALLVASYTNCISGTCL
ncbi:hypothetical protein GE061_013193 [Apolygus lucorum]|uniref:Uncharacterized protein n=1 Tax=Apolygus lucorum TaxID=248454 RepID=A0A8S9XUR2_APOLU|nr:hypothetical protein GE061_013193 [Apolygus lucorum]